MAHNMRVRRSDRGVFAPIRRLTMGFESRTDLVDRKVQNSQFELSFSKILAIIPSWIRVNWELELHVRVCQPDFDPFSYDRSTPGGV